jgi:hypothetical protein
MASRGLEIDFETADRITILTLKEQVGYLKEELRQHTEEGSYMHPEDVADSVKRIPMMESIIKYFGGTV